MLLCRVGQETCNYLYFCKCGMYSDIFDASQLQVLELRGEEIICAEIRVLKYVKICFDGVFL